MEGGRGGCVVRACLEHIGGFGHGPGSRSISNEISHGHPMAHHPFGAAEAVYPT